MLVMMDMCCFAPAAVEPKDAAPLLLTLTAGRRRARPQSSTTTSPWRAGYGQKAEHDTKCAVVLDAYVQCIKSHEGERPKPYELEWCHAEREAYRSIRGLDDGDEDDDDDVGDNDIGGNNDEGGKS